MHDAYPVSNIRPLCTYWGWSSILTVLLITFPSTINWEKVSIPYLQEESKSISHFQLIEAPLDWLESTFKILPILMLYVGYIVVIYRYQAFSFSISSQNTKLKCSIRPDRSFNSPWILAIPADSAGCLKWIWDHYLPSNLNVSLQRSCQGLLPSVLPSFKLKKAGYEPEAHQSERAHWD